MMTKGKIHSQVDQRCEHPNLSGNGPTQAVLIQCPTANRSPESKIARRNHHPKKEDQEAKFTHRLVNDVSIPISVGMVPLRLL